MDDDRTVIRLPNQPQSPPDSDQTVVRPAERLLVDLLDAGGKVVGSYSFIADFSAGRAPDNGVVINHPQVSRRHLQVRKERGVWWLQNAQSANGVFLHGKRVESREPLSFPALVTLGPLPFRLEIRIVGAAQALSQPAPAREDPTEPGDRDDTPPRKSSRELSAEELRSRLMDEHDADDAGDYTRFVRRIIREDRTQRSRSYKKTIWGLGIFGALCVALATYQHFALANARELAIGMFYDIKTLEVGLAQASIRLEETSQILEQTISTVNSEKLRVDQERIKAEREKIVQEKQRMAQDANRLKLMQEKYRQYVEQANSLRLRFPTAEAYEDELIAKVARGFGESELEVPEDFVAEVKKYIQAWQKSSRLQKGIETLQNNGYGPTVISALERENLPPQFIYLPLQESDYDNQAIGPETRYGIAKGAWQLLPTTAQDYGLAPGPLAATRDFDAQDPRFDFGQATLAGTKYLRRIYGTEAQASGLLVMASYNYGHNRVRNMIKAMPDNPRDRNFWKFIHQNDIPKETYDYVFYIFSAAVIGEDPQHFGFKFKPPLLASR
jgi:membrane-bound lytic murein transglycosylase D